MNAKIETTKNIQMLYTGRVPFVLLFFMLPVSLMAANGDMFMAKTAEGVKMYFEVISEANKTCQVGYDSKASVDKSTMGTITIPNSVNEYVVTSIGRYAFSSCSGLTSINIPNSVWSIGEGAFQYCSGLTNITIPNSVTSIGREAFLWSGLTSIKLPMFLTRISEAMFRSCSSLTDITIPSYVTSIDGGAFDGCSGLTTVTIPISVTTISESAFMDCSGLINVTIPNHVTSIGERAFSGCSGLKNVTIPNSVTSIGRYAFEGCLGLTSVVVREHNSVYDSRDNCNAIIETSTNNLLIGCKNTIIPNSVTSIGDYAFSRCLGLTSVNIPNSVTNIGEGAFQMCSGLTTVTIPYSVTSIGSKAFFFCLELKRVISNIRVPFEINDDVFAQDYNNAYPTLYVPEGTDLLYKSTQGWNKMTIMIQQGNTLGEGDTFVVSTIEGVKITYTIKNIIKKQCSVTNFGNSAIENQTAKHVTIPETANGFTVTGIDNEALAGCKSLISISFPSTITTPGKQIFKDCNNLAAIQWYADATLPMSAMEGVSNPNLLLYVKNESYAPKGNWIVVKNGVADDIVLHETASGNNFYCPKEFTARSVKYTHNYSMSSGYKTCQGWETIALPFDVANISYQESVELVPYKTWEPGSQQRPFWLYEQTAEGWKPATAIKGNTPFIICMPNNKDKYDTSYNIEGDITFQATGCKVYASDSIKPMKYAERSFVAAFQEQAVGSNIYALNVNNAWDSYTYSTYLPGSTFIIGLRPVHPFEAYMTTDSANAPQYIPVFDEEEVITGIPVLANDKVLKGEAVIYDLSGRRITNSTDKNLLKGVYIVNGRKVVVK